MRNYGCGSRYAGTVVMETPIIDFVKNYSNLNSLRLHMPGHKGAGPFGFEKYDITEIFGADSLYEAKGIIAKSEENASMLFGTERTFFSTEGSSQCIRAMLELIRYYSAEKGEKPLILAGRNAHKVFTVGAALLDIDVEWIYGENISYLSCDISEKALNKSLSSLKRKPTAIYLTSPDYLGNVADIRRISEICKSQGILLAVDNAHGAYLKFLTPDSLHPIDLGADICSDSAHKTLPCLTGGAYLHISKHAPECFKTHGKKALEMFGSTSPSYLILQSLDFVNKYISDGYKNSLADFKESVDSLKSKLISKGFKLIGNEPLKITVDAKSYGYPGTTFAEILSKQDIICEFCDPDYITFMLTPENGKNGIFKLENELLKIPRLKAIKISPPCFKEPIINTKIRDALFSPSVSIAAENSKGRIMSSADTGCPPAVPIAICGEIITQQTIEAFKYYGIEKINVIK